MITVLLADHLFDFIQSDPKQTLYLFWTNDNDLYQFQNSDQQLKYVNIFIKFK